MESELSFLNVIYLLNVLNMLVTYHSNILKDFKVMVLTKFYNFWRLGKITHAPSQLELSFLYPTPLPNALYNLTKFHENSSKGIEIIIMYNNVSMDRQTDGFHADCYIP